MLAFGSTISYSEEKHFLVSGLPQPCLIFTSGYKGGQSVSLTLEAHSNFLEKTKGLGVHSCGKETFSHSGAGTLAQDCPKPRIQ